MIALIEKLIEQGAAYRAQSGVYFSVEGDADYGKLSNRSQEDIRTGTRVEGEEDKRAPSDFALWKAVKPGEPFWDASFGAGRPGWHIECSAMIEAVLGRTIDIHGGGIDLIFPHHENEIAQSETAHGHPLARYWLHNGFLTIDSEKMAKSIGNVLLVHDLVREWPGEVLRWALLSAHYRQPLDWTDTLLEQSKASLDRLYGALHRLRDVQPTDEPAPPALVEALGDDLNTPKAIAELSALATEANVAKAPADQAKAKGALLAAGALLGMFGVHPDAWFHTGGDVAEIETLVAERVAARKARNWAEADRLRAVLTEMGVIVMDGPEGSTWRRV
jgi:cysteinyl-tRNA synthetase